jgi:hypothetical protein
LPTADDHPPGLAALPSTAPETGVMVLLFKTPAPPANAGEQPAQWQARVAGQLANKQFGAAGRALLKDLSKRTPYR